MPLSELHRKMLEIESGINPKIIEERGYRTLTKKNELKDLGFSGSQQIVPALLIPIHNVHGKIELYQSRPDFPRINKNGKTVKYEIPFDSQMILDIHPQAKHDLINPKKPLFITEGIKKGDSLVSHGVCAVALLGVWNFRGTNHYGGKTALPDWESIALNDRKVYIVFDSDLMEKSSVYSSLIRLKSFLENRKADVQLIYLPCSEGGIKQGVDDFLSSGKNINDLLDLATRELKKPITEEKTSSENNFKKQISQIRNDTKLKNFEKKREISELVKNDLMENGRFISSQEESFYFFDKKRKLFKTNERHFQFFINERYGLNETEEEFKFLLSEMS